MSAPWLVVVVSVLIIFLICAAVLVSSLARPHEELGLQRATDQRRLRPRKEINTSIDAWYINLPNAYARKTCVERQLNTSGFNSVNRFVAAAYPKGCGCKLQSEAERKETVQCLRSAAWGDCAQGGLYARGLTQHGTKNLDLETQNKHVWSLYCSHQRLFAHIANNSSADYIVVFEDDVIVSQYFVTWVRHILKYLPLSPWFNWGVLQIDAFGRTIKAVPLMMHSDMHASSFYVPRSGMAYGSHALLIKRSFVRNLTDCMMNSKAVPFDWVFQQCAKRVLVWSVQVNPNVVQQAEMFRFYSHKQFSKLPVPSYCPADGFKSSIR